MYPQASRPGMVIIGAGEAGTRAALTLREKHFDGPITLIGAEAHLPYERPPLSKALQTSAEQPPPTLIGGVDQLEALKIDYRPSVVVTGIDRLAKTVALTDEEPLPYSQLLLATGARPRTLSLPGGQSVLYLRTFSDALALRTRLISGSRLVVIGGGFIGLEVAASGIERGCAVTVVEMAPRILGRAVPAEIASLVAASHREAGVTIIDGVTLVGIESTGTCYTVSLGDGRALQADVIVAGIGAIPETTLAEAAGLAVNNGIVVDGRLSTEDPAIFAAGDCCSFPHIIFGGRRLRLEAWRNAQDQGRHVAASMLGAEDLYTAVPWFWSDQHGKTLQIAGLPDEGDHVVPRDICGMPF